MILDHMFSDAIFSNTKTLWATHTLTFNFLHLIMRTVLRKHFNCFYLIEITWLNLTTESFVSLLALAYIVKYAVQLSYDHIIKLQKQL